MAQLVALMSGLVLGDVAEVVGSNLARGKIFTASIGSVDSLYPSVYILKAIKNATGTSDIFPKNISLIHVVFVPTSVPNVGERFTKI